VTTNCESPLIAFPRLKPAVKDMERKNPSEKNLKNRMLIEATRAFTRNDPLTQALRHYPARVPYNVR
jgi:hypothetical protein